MREKILTPFLLIVITVLFGCAGSINKVAAPVKHPEELTSRDRDCLECHDDDLTGTLKPYGTFRHSSTFLLRHLIDLRNCITLLRRIR